tara:strand:- start:599 stop:958 length:360 start_codon:yes stop_codon:yes gene_type:complete
MNKLLLILLIFSFLMPQEPCNGTCYTEEEEINIENHITNLETKLKVSDEKILLLNGLITDYKLNDSLNVSLINDYKQQLIFKEEMIDLVKPKWHENKYLWFFGGVILTSGAVYLAGQID